MKALVVFYSRTGMTKKIANAISASLDADIEEIEDVKSRRGVIGFLKSGREATLKKLADIRETKKNPSVYDIAIIGTPVWAANISSPVRTYLSQNNGRFKRVAFFCTMGGSGDSRPFKEMETVCGLKPVALLALKTEEVSKGAYAKKVEEFVYKIRSAE
jgi:flavodoxin